MSGRPKDGPLKLVSSSSTSAGSLLNVATDGVRLIGRLYSGLLPALLSRGPMVMLFLPLVEQVRVRVFKLGYI